ncbi:MAG: hypothetical protein ACOCXP_03265 [Candidatus Dojkabacteria bacterium]
MKSYESFQEQGAKMLLAATVLVSALGFFTVTAVNIAIALLGSLVTAVFSASFEGELKSAVTSGEINQTQKKELLE